MLGGDKREQEIARRAAATGAHVRAHGFPWPEQGIPDVKHLNDPAAVLKGAKFALFPIPGISASGALFAPAAPAPIVPDRAMLEGMAPRAHIILGWADKNLKAHADALNIGLHEYEWDRSLMLQRTPAILEGLLKIVIENTAITIHNSHACVVGQGTIGAVLTRYLVALGAHTHIAARNAEQRAQAFVAGATPHLLEELPELAPRLDFVFSTVPSRVVGEDVLSRLPKSALIVSHVRVAGPDIRRRRVDLGPCGVERGADPPERINRNEQLAADPIVRRNIGIQDPRPSRRHRDQHFVDVVVACD